jgi:hypothetical protein
MDVFKWVLLMLLGAWLVGSGALLWALVTKHEEFVRTVRARVQKQKQKQEEEDDEFLGV